jgi:hypothetical protein
MVVTSDTKRIFGDIAHKGRVDPVKIAQRDGVGWGRRVRVSHAYDIPYIAGYSADGRTVFIDRHLPRTFRSWTQTIRVAQFLLVHEIIEKAFLRICRRRRFRQQSAREQGSLWRAA